MFGLEQQTKKGKEEAPVFDLEKDMRDPAKFQAMKKTIEKRINTLKDALRKGEIKDDFDNFGILLLGYVALARVIERAKTGKKLVELK